MSFWFLVEKSIEPAIPSETQSPKPTLASNITSEFQETAHSPTPLAEEGFQSNLPAAEKSNLPSSESQEILQVRPTQNDQSRCFVCRAKIPLAKQTINKCRCGKSSMK